MPKRGSASVAASWRTRFLSTTTPRRRASSMFRSSWALQTSSATISVQPPTNVANRRNSAAPSRPADRGSRRSPHAASAGDPADRVARRSAAAAAAPAAEHRLGREQLDAAAATRSPAASRPAGCRSRQRSWRSHQSARSPGARRLHALRRGPPPRTVRGQRSMAKSGGTGAPAVGRELVLGAQAQRCAARHQDGKLRARLQAVR